MLFFYEDYVVKEKKEAFLVSEDVFEDKRVVRIKKSLLESLGSDKEPEMLAIILGKIELIRLETKMHDRNAPRSFIGKEEFIKNFKNLVNSVKSADAILAEISEMKYHELKETFIGDIVNE